MEFDITTIAISGIGLLIGIVYILTGGRLFRECSEESLKTERSLPINAKNFMLRCLITLLIVILLNCLVEGRWDMDFIIDFLLLKKVGIWALRASASLVYMCILWGLVLEFKRNISKKREHVV
jgi:hypothetical protein